MAAQPARHRRRATTYHALTFAFATLVAQERHLNTRGRHRSTVTPTRPHRKLQQRPSHLSLTWSRPEIEEERTTTRRLVASCSRLPPPPACQSTVARVLPHLRVDPPWGGRIWSPGYRIWRPWPSSPSRPAAPWPHLQGLSSRHTDFRYPAPAVRGEEEAERRDDGSGGLGAAHVAPGGRRREGSGVKKAK